VGEQLALDGLRELRRRNPSGRPPKLTKVQRKALLRLLKRDAKQAGFRTERWASQRIAQVIEREFQVVYHPHYMADLLQQWHWSLQVPVPRAKERDEALIRAIAQRQLELPMHDN
jgi:transposase